MRIIDLLKDSNSRVVYGDTWLVLEYDSDTSWEWVVYRRQYGKKKVEVLIRTQNEQEAVKILYTGLPKS